MSRFQSVADQLQQSLSLPVVPIAIAFVDEVPAGVDAFTETVAAGCVFWEKAAERTFATQATDHELCSIGVHTHNLSGASTSQAVELKAALTAMTGLDYVRDNEVSGIPVMAKASKHVIYGPLAQAPVEPDVVLLFAHAQQGLIISESVSRVDGGMPIAMGRPACAVVPQVSNQNNAAMSLGCCGARAYLKELSDAVALWSLPGAKIDNYAEQIKTLAGANQMLTQFHDKRRQDVQAGGRPTVDESLARLS